MMPVRTKSHESINRSSESISGSGGSSTHRLPGLGLDAEGSWNSHVLAGDTMLFAAPSLESLYIIDSFEEPHNDFEVDQNQDMSPQLSSSPRHHRKGRDGKSGKQAQTSFFGSLFGGSGSSKAKTEDDDLSLTRRPSCDILLSTAPITDAAALAPGEVSYLFSGDCDDSGHPQHASVAVVNVIAPACEPDSPPNSPATQHRHTGGAAYARPAGVDQINTDRFGNITRDVVLSRQDRNRSFGMYIRATRDGRVLVTGVELDSPAAACGIQVGDELVVVNGFCVKSWPAKYVARCLVEGDLACKLTILHNPRLTEKLLSMGMGGASAQQAALSSTLGLADKHQSTSSLDSTGSFLSNTGSCPSSPRSSQNSSSYVRKHMILRVDGTRAGSQVPEGGLGLSVQGGRVHTVAPGSAAEAAGLAAGEYVVAVGKRDVVGISDCEIEDMLRDIKGFFSISTVPEVDIDDYVMTKTMEELLRAGAR